MESSCERTKLNLKAKIPDIEKTLELVRVLQEKQVRCGGRPILFVSTSRLGKMNRLRG